MYILENWSTSKFSSVTGQINHNPLVQEARRRAIGEIKRGRDRVQKAFEYSRLLLKATTLATLLVTAVELTLVMSQTSTKANLMRHYQIPSCNHPRSTLNVKLKLVTSCNSVNNHGCVGGDVCLSFTPHLFNVRVKFNAL